MPTILRDGPYRFFFYSGDCDEPPHVHIERDTSVAKFWLVPVRLENSGGFHRHELHKIQRIVEERQAALLESWNEYFDR